MNRHGLTGALLQQPNPPAMRIMAMFDPEQPCLKHATAYQGSIPCTGAYACNLCGTSWDEAGKITGNIYRR